MINTVTGPIKKEDLGLTLSHEHLFCDFCNVDNEDEMFGHFYNTLLPYLQEIALLGCKAIAEVSSRMDKLNLKLMKQLSKDSGVKIIPSTGLSYSGYENEENRKNNNLVQEMTNEWINDFNDGIEIISGTKIKPSHIKIFTTDLSDIIERKVLEAAIITSNETGLPIHCHILSESLAQEVFDILDKNNFDYNKFLWAHAGFDNHFELMEKVVDKGMWLGFDIIQEKNYEKYYDMIITAIEKGYSDKILLSADYDTYDEIKEHGNNHPCHSLLKEFIPYCVTKGLKKETLVNILTSNPSNYFNI